MAQGVAWVALVVACTACSGTKRNFDTQTGSSTGASGMAGSNAGGKAATGGNTGDGAASGSGTGGSVSQGGDGGESGSTGEGGSGGSDIDTCTCSELPPATCKDSTTLNTFPSPGVCTAGTCGFEPVEKSCQFGCALGACLTNSCSSSTCNAPDQCHSGPGTCDSVTGRCTYPNKADNSPCSNIDSNACTADTCQAGICKSAAPKTCPAPETCRTQGTCDKGTGACSTPVAADHASCGTNLECLSGSCQCTVTSCPNGCCTGGACAACTPTTLATRAVSIQSLTIASPLLYFLEGRNEGDPLVYSLPTAGGTAQLLSIPSPADTSLNLIFADGSYVYGSSFKYNRVGRMPTYGGQFSLLPDSNSYNATAFRANSTSLVTGCGLSSNVINVFPKAGGTPKLLIDSLTINNIRFAVDESFLYFIGGNAISRIPLVGGEATTVTAAVGEELFYDVALAGNQLVFASTARVGAVAIGGGTASTLDAGSGYLAVTDATMAYFFRAKNNSATCASGSDLFSIPVAGGPLRRLATEPATACVRSVVHDASAVYWLTDKAIRKMAK